jgi:hypothetical protein
MDDEDWDWPHVLLTPADWDAIYRIIELERLGYYKRLLGRTRTLEPTPPAFAAKINIGKSDHYVVNTWGVARAVAGVVREWREVASLRRFRAPFRMAPLARLQTFGDLLETSGLRQR